jgi:hypothetical protein
MVAMLLRDKALLYQHNLAAETWTKNKEMLRWNMGLGYALSNAFYDQAAGMANPDNEWLTLIGVFQKYALARYAAERPLTYEKLDNDIWRTTFPSVVVHSNWSADKPFTLDGATIPPGGVITQAKDKSLTAGVFTAYNGQELSSGDHYLVENRTEVSVKIFQPVGADTKLTVKFAGKAIVTAYGWDDKPLGVVASTSGDDNVTFIYQGTLNSQPVAYYTLTQ